MVLELHLGTMILINVNDLLKFMLESVANYVSVLVIAVMCFFFLTSFVTIVVEKVTNMVGTWIMLHKGHANVQIEKIEKVD